MSFPSTISLASSAKYFGFVDPKNAYNANWDITWSFTFALTGIQHGFCTFLTTNPLLSSAIPGQYLGYLGNYPYLMDETGEFILSEDFERLTYETPSTSAYDISGVLAIAFDSTGYFALSDSDNSGIAQPNAKSNSLIVRSNNRLVFNEHLSSLDTSFFLASSVKSYQTLRFRLANGNKLYVDYQIPSSKYKNLATINLSSFKVDENQILYPAFSFSSPISSNSIPPSTIWMKNFHTQGCESSPTYETVQYTPLLTESGTIYTTISGISANPV